MKKAYWFLFFAALLFSASARADTFYLHAGNEFANGLAHCDSPDSFSLPNSLGFTANFKPDFVTWTDSSWNSFESSHEDNSPRYWDHHLFRFSNKWPVQDPTDAPEPPSRSLLGIGLGTLVVLSAFRTKAGKPRIG
jgi:hypothetical protein